MRPAGTTRAPTASESTATTTTTEQVVVQGSNGDFNAAEIYERAAPGRGHGDLDLRRRRRRASAAEAPARARASSSPTTARSSPTPTWSPRAARATAAASRSEANQVFVEFSDRNRVPAEIVGFDPDADVALIKVDPEGLDLTPLPLSDREEYAVGEPVAAIGSPFGERQSLSIGIVSAIDRSIESLTAFSIDNAIQTDASINPGNSGGPLLDGKGEVIGINQQIETQSGSNSGVGFAIPATAIRYSLDQLREDGEVEYAYLGVSTQGVYPQLADELDIDSDTGALISAVVPGGPADKAGLQGSDGEQTFQGLPDRDRRRRDRRRRRHRAEERERPRRADLPPAARPDRDPRDPPRRRARKQVEVELEPRPERVAQHRP